MSIKVFHMGSDWQHKSRLRESMMKDSLCVWPLLLLFKCHKSGKPPPTRNVGGGNSRMNLHTYDIMSWILQPVAYVLQGRSEVISNEHLKSKIDMLNEKNKNWKPDVHY